MSTLWKIPSKEQWNDYLLSSKHLSREVNGYWPAFFPQRKQTGHESSILEKVFWKIFLATRDIKEVEEFWSAYFMMTTNMKDYILVDNEALTKVFRDTMEGQFEHNLYNKSFSNQLDCDETDALQQRIDWWMAVVDEGGSIPNDVYDQSFAELFNLYRKTIDPEMQEFEKLSRRIRTFQEKQVEKQSVNNNLTQKWLRKTFKIFIDEIYSNAPKKIYATRKPIFIILINLGAEIY